MGVVLLGVSAWVESVRSDYQTINDALLSPTLLGIIVGILMIITAFCGLIGALRENLVLLKIVSISLQKLSTLQCSFRNTLSKNELVSY